MEIYNTKWQTRTVLKIDLVFTIIVMIFNSVRMIMAAEVSVKNLDSKGTDLTIFVLRWIVIILYHIVVMFQLWVALQLLLTTNDGRDVSQTIQAAKPWRSVTILNVCFTASLDLILSLWNPYVIVVFIMTLILRVASLFIVQRYVNELIRADDIFA